MVLYGLASPTSGYICTGVHREDVQTHTRIGHRELSREARVETDWETKEPKELKPALAQNGIASGNKEAAVV
jgi:hypothetical protein